MGDLRGPVMPVPSSVREELTRLRTALAESEAMRGRQMTTIDEMNKTVMVLGEECRLARVCVGPDPLYGWDEPRHLDDSEPEWHELDTARQRTNADPAARAAVKGAQA